MRRFASHQILGALTLIASLSGCGRGAEDGNNALASLDTRLADNLEEGNAAAPAVSAEAAGAKTPKGDSATLGGLAEKQRSGDEAGAVTQRLASAAGRSVGGCAGRGLRYGDQWVKAMPEGLGLYPGGRLVEAAGTDTGRCALRVISFTTADSPEAVVSHYTARVRAAGFDAERQPCKTEIRLGGTRTGDDAAYLLFARRGAQGVTEVDIIASAGPVA